MNKDELQTKHTPGPWHLHYGTCERGGNKGKPILESIINKEACRTVIGPNYCTAEGDVWQAWLSCRPENANLIAAAPDLLEALQAVVIGEYGSLSEFDRQLDLHQSESFPHWQKARAAIAKAEGKAQS